MKGGKPLTAVGTCQDITERKNNEDEINRAYVERNLVLESIDDGFFASDKNSLVTYWNRKAEILLGVKKEDVLGKNPHEMFADNRSRVFHDNYQKALRENTTVRFEGFSHRTSKWFAVSAFAFDNGLSVYFRDETERKKDEEKLKASELRYRQIVETAQEGIWLIDENHITTFVNSKMCEILEYTEAEMIGKDIFYFMNEEGQALAAKLMDRKKDGFAEQAHFKYISKSGNEIWTNLSANPLFDEKGVYKGSLAMVTDITQSKRAEKKDQFQAALLNTIGQAAIATDMQGKINFWNKAASALYGWTEEEVMGNNIIEITPIQQTKEQAEQIMQELLHGNSWSGEFTVRRKDGSEFPAFVTNAPIYDQQQQLIGIIGLSADITRRKQAERELKESNERYQLISKATNDMVWDWDLVTGKVYRNKEGWKKIFRTSDTETEKEVKDDWATKIHPEDKDKISILTNQIRKSTEGSYEMECRVMRNDGTVAFIHDRGTIVRDQHGKATRVIGATQDITERKKAEAAVLDTLNEKNTILESIGDGFFAADENWTVTYWNNHAEEMLGVSKEQIVGKRLWDVFKDSIDSESYKQYHRAMAANEVIQFEDLFKPSNRWYEISAYPSLPGVAVYFKDITDRKRSEIQLNQLNASLQRQAKELAISNAELEQFAYVASHDLQEPLRMITSFLTQLEKKYGDVIDAKGKKYIDFAVDGAKRMRRIILDLLEYSRVGRIDSKQEIIDLNELVDEIQILFRKQIQEKNAVIISGSLPHVPGNRAPIRQVFQNLISNALKFVEKDHEAQINIDCAEFEDHWQFAVRDNGIGIDQEYFDKIFIIFQRLHNKDEFSGTGMGLAITKKILENEGGRIWVESEEGKGSTFHFTIKKEKDMFVAIHA
jgi:PAS domain S-box-containing protein